MTFKRQKLAELCWVSLACAPTLNAGSTSLLHSVEDDDVMWRLEDDEDDTAG